MKSSSGWAAIEGNSVVLDGVALKIPGYTLDKEIGRGANAVIFKAKDDFLGRDVAIKIWNTKGRRRAQLETKKIANLRHPLIVITHYFGFVENYPYSIMELLLGNNGKEWMLSKPGINERLKLWDLYFESLSYIHEQDLIHGDPHLGNILIIKGPSYCENSSDFTIKLADTGASEFWKDKKAIKNREAQLVFETASRLLKDQDLVKLWHQPKGLSHRRVIDILSSLFEFIGFMSGHLQLSIYHSEIPNRLVSLIIETPLFHLDEFVKRVENHHSIRSERFIRRLNHKLLNLPDILDAETTLSPEAINAYNAHKKSYLKGLIG